MRSTLTRACSRRQVPARTRAKGKQVGTITGATVLASCTSKCPTLAVSLTVESRKDLALRKVDIDGLARSCRSSQGSTGAASDDGCPTRGRSSGSSTSSRRFSSGSGDFPSTRSETCNGVFPSFTGSESCARPNPSGRGKAPAGEGGRRAGHLQQARSGSGDGIEQRKRARRVRLVRGGGTRRVRLVRGGGGGASGNEVSAKGC